MPTYTRKTHQLLVLRFQQHMKAIRVLGFIRGGYVRLGIMHEASSEELVCKRGQAFTVSLADQIVHVEVLFMRSAMDSMRMSVAAPPTVEVFREELIWTIPAWAKDLRSLLGQEKKLQSPCG